MLFSTAYTKEVTNVNPRTHTDNTLCYRLIHKFNIACVCTCARETAGVKADSCVCLFVYVVGSDVAVVTEHLQWSVGR